MAETTFKYQARKNFEDGSYVQINTGEKDEFEEFYQEYLFPTGTNAKKLKTKPVAEAKKPTEPTLSTICQICGTEKVKGTWDGKPWWKCPNYKKHPR